MRVFSDKSIVKADSRLFWTLFLVRFPYKNMVKIEVFDTFLSKSIVNPENGVFFTPIFSTILL